MEAPGPGPPPRDLTLPAKDRLGPTPPREVWLHPSHEEAPCPCSSPLGPLAQWTHALSRLGVRGQGGQEVTLRVFRIQLEAPFSFPRGEGVCRGMNVTVHPTGLQGQYRGSCE